MAKSTPLSLVDRMRATKLVEEELRPNLPANIQTNATWLNEAKRIMDESPEVYAGIVARLADGDSNKTLAKLTKLPIELIRKIRELHPQAIEAGRKATYARLEEALQSSAERLADEGHKVPISRLAVHTAILYDKVSMANGQPTARIEHIRAPTKEDLDAMFAALPQANVTEVVKE